MIIFSKQSSPSNLSFWAATMGDPSSCNQSQTDKSEPEEAQKWIELSVSEWERERETLQDKSLMQQPWGCCSTLTSKTGQTSKEKNFILYT